MFFAGACSFYNVSAFPAALLKKKLRQFFCFINLAEFLELFLGTLSDDFFCNKISYSKLTHAKWRIHRKDLKTKLQTAFPI